MHIAIIQSLPGMYGKGDNYNNKITCLLCLSYNLDCIAIWLLFYHATIDKDHAVDKLYSSPCYL